MAELHREFRAEGRDTLVVAGTHSEISQLTDAIRHDRKDRGELGVGHSFDPYVSLQWTTRRNKNCPTTKRGRLCNSTETQNWQNAMSLWKSCVLSLNLWLREKKPVKR